MNYCSDKSLSPRIAGTLLDYLLQDIKEHIPASAMLEVCIEIQYNIIPA